MAICWKRVLLMVVLIAGVEPCALAKDLRITIPRRSQLAPVQRLNREGVDAVQKGHFDKAKALFYKAYLLDPGDPFTLNNLGYIAEMEGQQDRAETFYGLASGQGTEAFIDKASSAGLKGQTLQTALSAARDIPIQVNRANVAAVRLLSEDRAPEADLVLERALTLDAKNGFTLNNMGVAKEAEGEYVDAIRYYSAAVRARTSDTVVVTTSAAWRGKSVSEMAAESARKLNARMNRLQTTESQTALFNLRGVSALNRNDSRAAWENFSQAFRLAPNNAFSLNNQGVMSEISGDLETAQSFYREAQIADGSRARVGLATRRVAEGVRLDSVASGSEDDVSTAMESANQIMRRNAAPVQLKHRDGTLVVEPAVAPAAPQSSPSHP
jgi:Flp pilus assembly protein TadD